MHPSNRESSLTSGLPTCWRTCKLPHCAMDPNVAFWYDYLSPAWMHQSGGGVLSLGDTQQEMSVGLLEKIVAGKKEYFQRRNSAVHLLLRRWWLGNSTWNCFYMFNYERLFLLLMRHTIHHHHHHPASFNNSTNNNVAFFVVSDLKIEYYNSY